MLNGMQLEKLAEQLKKYPSLKLLLLFGSRAREDALENSDWDFGYIAEKGFDPADLYTDLTLLLKTDKVDLVDLSRASGLLRFRAAKNNILLFDCSSREYDKFWQQAVYFWCDVSELLRREYDAILRSL